MAILCSECGAEYDVTLFAFDRAIRCDCGALVELATGHIARSSDHAGPEPASSALGSEGQSEIAAYHEAGHSFTAACQGAGVRLTTIDPDWDDGPERYGDTQVEWPRSGFSKREFHEKRVLVALAGPVAEMLYRGEAWHPGLVAEWAGDWTEAWEAAGALHSDERKRLALLERTAMELCRLLDREDHWAALAVLADHLLAHETLEGNQVAEILADWLGPS